MFLIFQDYGTLLCWGSNDFGAQTEPCVFTIIPAGKIKLIYYSFIFMHSQFFFLLFLKTFKILGFYVWGIRQILRLKYILIFLEIS